MGIYFNSFFGFTIDFSRVKANQGLTTEMKVSIKLSAKGATQGFKCFSVHGSSHRGSASIEVWLCRINKYVLKDPNTTRLSTIGSDNLCCRSKTSSTARERLLFGGQQPQMDHKREGKRMKHWKAHKSSCRDRVLPSVDSDARRHSLSSSLPFKQKAALSLLRGPRVPYD